MWMSVREFVGRRLFALSQWFLLVFCLILRSNWIPGTGSLASVQAHGSVFVARALYFCVAKAQELSLSLSNVDVIPLLLQLLLIVTTCDHRTTTSRRFASPGFTFVSLPEFYTVALYLWIQFRNRDIRHSKALKYNSSHWTKLEIATKFL